MSHTIMINPVLRNMPAHVIRHGFEPIRSICHGHTRTDALQHLNIVISVSKRNRF